MFINRNFQSINKLNDLPTGRMRCVAKSYQSASGQGDMLWVEYFWESEEMATVIDVVINRQPHGYVERDFLRLPDRSWRDCFGEKANSIDELLRENLNDWIEVKTWQESEIFVEKENG